MTSGCKVGVDVGAKVVWGVAKGAIVSLGVGVAVGAGFGRVHPPRSKPKTIKIVKILPICSPLPQK